MFNFILQSWYNFVFTLPVRSQMYCSHAYTASWFIQIIASTLQDSFRIVFGIVGRCPRHLYSTSGFCTLFAVDLLLCGFVAAFPITHMHFGIHNGNEPEATTLLGPGAKPKDSHGSFPAISWSNLLCEARKFSNVYWPPWLKLHSTSQCSQFQIYSGLWRLICQKVTVLQDSCHSIEEFL